jgi:hypothetical protein
VMLMVSESDGDGVTVMVMVSESDGDGVTDYVCPEHTHTAL